MIVDIFIQNYVYKYNIIIPSVFQVVKANNCASNCLWKAAAIEQGLNTVIEKKNDKVSLFDIALTFAEQSRHELSCKVVCGVCCFLR